MVVAPKGEMRRPSRRRGPEITPASSASGKVVPSSTAPRSQSAMNGGSSAIAAEGAGATADAPLVNTPSSTGFARPPVNNGFGGASNAVTLEEELRLARMNGEFEDSDSDGSDLEGEHAKARKESIVCPSGEVAHQATTPSNVATGPMAEVSTPAPAPKPTKMVVVDEFVDIETGSISLEMFYWPRPTTVFVPPKYLAKMERRQARRQRKLAAALAQEQRIQGYGTAADSKPIGASV